MTDPHRPCPRVTLAHSGLSVSRIGVGLAHVHLMAPAERLRLVSAALDLGITHFDTARFYSDGLSECVLGAALAGRRDAATITTKFGLLPTPVIGGMGPLAPIGRKARSALVRLKLARYPRRLYTPALLKRSLTASLRALRTDHVDVLAIHEPVGATGLSDELVDALVMVKRAGMARFVGVAGATIDAVVARWGDVLDVVQTAEDGWRGDHRVPDFTYGVFSSGARRGQPPLDQSEIDRRLARALTRRPIGGVIVQTRTPERLRRFVAIAAR